MFRSDHRISFRAHYGVILIAIILLTASCNELATPTIEQVPVNTPTEQIADFPASMPKISVGQHLRFDTISLEQGLLQSTVDCMLQDSQGFMWFGTESGLNKYDGYTFTIYQHNPDDSNSLISNWTSALLEDDSGLIWIGTNDGIVVVYDPSSVFSGNSYDAQKIWIEDGDESGYLLANEKITSIAVDGANNKWIGSKNGVWYVSQDGTEILYHFISI